ncbi:MAG TPA: sterol desaturase family protein [Candidatus Limnocylindrales bacterium]|nr:sterol desaturase family protein [Candidatus Limnocylindrales bacterium]
MPNADFTATLAGNLPAIATILIVMAALALLEAAIPLRGRGRWNRVHLAPNLTLTGITFATNLFFNTALVLMLAWLASRQFGLAHWLGLGAVAAAALTVIGLDFSFYVAHVAMHKVPALWRFHRVHHSDPALDVTTTIRQHPGEGVIRYAFMGAFAVALGAPPAAFAIYRAWSALNGLAEHADIRLPLWLDNALSLVTASPNYHKVHHSRRVEETDTNYGNIFSFFDRLFGTCTPAVRGLQIEYGLDGCDDQTMQTTRSLLAMPFSAPAPPSPATRPPRTSPGRCCEDPCLDSRACP